MLSAHHPGQLEPVTSDGSRELRQMWRATLAMFAIGSVTSLSIMVLPDPDASDHGAFIVAGLACALAALVSWRAGPRRWMTHASPYAGVVAVGAMTVLARPMNAVPLFYLWPAILGGYFLRRRELVVLMGVFVVSYGVALGYADFDPASRATWLVSVASTVIVVAALVNAMRANTDRLVAQLRASAATDPLTGLANRRTFEQALGRELGRTRRDGTPLTIALLDLDHFKQVNDRFGHAAGDDALCAVAAVLEDERREGDLIARFGGEEFVALLVGSDADGGQAFVERVAAAPAMAAAPGGPLSLSAGVASYGERALTRDDLMSAADDALYVAKQAGRCRIAVAGGAIVELRVPEPPAVAR